MRCRCRCRPCYPVPAKHILRHCPATKPIVPPGKQPRYTLTVRGVRDHLLTAGRRVGVAYEGIGRRRCRHHRTRTVSVYVQYDALLLSPYLACAFCPADQPHYQAAVQYSKCGQCIPPIRINYYCDYASNATATQPFFPCLLACLLADLPPVSEPLVLAFNRCLCRFAFPVHFHFHFHFPFHTRPIFPRLCLRLPKQSAKHQFNPHSSLLCAV